MWMRCMCKPKTPNLFLFVRSVKDLIPFRWAGAVQLHLQPPRCSLQLFGIICICTSCVHAFAYACTRYFADDQNARVGASPPSPAVFASGGFGHIFNATAGGWVGGGAVCTLRGVPFACPSGIYYSI